MSYKRSKPDLAFAMPAVFLFISLQAAGDEGLALSLKPSKPAFTTREAISFVVTVTNNAANPVSFFVMSYLGSSSIGRNEYLLRDAKGDAWEMVNNPRAVMPGAPAMARKVDLGTGKSFSSRIVLPGFGNLFRKSGDKLAKGARHLPVGKYTLKVKVTPIKSAIEAGPVEFQVTAAPPPLANPPGVTGEQALTAAKAYLAKRLHHYKDANRGKEPWDSLSVASFKQKTSSSAKYWSYRFEADLKKRKQTLIINIVVDGKGNVVSRNQGFAIYQKGPPPPPGLRAEPTVPR